MIRIISIILLILSLAAGQADARVLSGSKTERKLNRKVERLLKSARKQYDSGKVQQALDSYWKILELDPQETFAYLELGEIYYNLKIFDRAVELLEPGCQTAENEMDAETVCYYYCILTQAYVELKQLGKASKSLIKAAEASPKNPWPRKILGDIYLANNRIKSAYKAYKKALSFDPNYEPALEKIGELTTKYNIKVTKTPIRAVKATTQNSPAPRPEPVNEEVEDDEEPSEEAPRPTPMPTSGAEASGNDDLISVAIIPMPEKDKQKSAPSANESKPTASTSSAAETGTANVSPAPAAAEPVSVDQDDIDEQIDKLLAGSAEQKKEATDFFVSMKEKGIVEVEELLYDSDPEVRIVGIRALGAFKAHKDRVSTILRDSSDDPDPEVKKEIERVLGTLK